MMIRTEGRVWTWLVAVAVVAFGYEGVRGAAPVWTGAVDANWSTAGNWNAAPPLSGDSVVFNGTTPNNVTNNNINNLTLSDIVFNAGAASYTHSGSGVNLGWKTVPPPEGTGITYTGDISNNSSNAQTINFPITLDPAKHVIRTGTAALNLHGPITQPKGSTVFFETGGGAINVAGSGLANVNGVLGTWATIGTDLAAVDGFNNVVPFTAYTVVDPVANPAVQIADNPVSNVRIPFREPGGTPIETAATVTRVNSIVYGDGVNDAGVGAAQQINLVTGKTLVLGQNSGIFNTTGANGNAVRNLQIGPNVAGSGTVTAGDGVNPANITFSSIPINVAPQGQAGITTVNAVITDNGSAPVSVTIRGGYVTLPAANTYSGGTYVVSGRLSQPTGATVGSGPIYVFPGGMINPGAAVPVTIPNNLFIAGNGTTENNGLGAIRMFQNTDGNDTLLTGTVTLMADASVSSNGNINPARRVGITGKITGPGGLGIGSPNSTNNNGVGDVVIGALTGPGVRHDYAGDTTINGGAGGANGSGLIITNPDADHILPHGNAGSFAGGATGNVILNAAAGRRATFDLNGSQQTINGLSNTAESPTENMVTSGAAGGRLYVGDSNATAAYGGNIDNGAGLSIVKIGSGTQTLVGVNTYAGDTRIYGGVLSIASPFLSAASDVHVSAGAVFNLNYAAGVPATIDSLYFNGAPQATGTWGSLASTATNKSDRFTGTGVITVSNLGGALLAADFDGDRDVDLADLAKWKSDFGVTPGSDADFDGDSDGNDFLVWQRQLGQTIPGAGGAAAAVPEPGALSLLGVATMTLVAAHRRGRFGVR